MCSCDFGGPECFSEAQRVARKEHRCVECGGTIVKGDIYRHMSGIWDGTPDTFKWCDTCTTIYNLVSGWHEEDRRAFFDLPIEKRYRRFPPERFCFTYGDMLECAVECLHERKEARDAA